MKSLLRLPVLFLALLVVTAGGCDSTGSGTRPTDKTLEPGGSARTEAGVRLLAPQEAIGESITVGAETAPDAGTSAPLPKETTAAGEVFRISGGRDIDLGQSDPPLYYALPVNQDANHDQLALGVRVPRSMTTDRVESPSSEYGWSVVPGAYEPERGLVVVPTRFLVKDGVRVVALEDPTYSAPSMAGADGETLFEKTKNFFSQNESTRTQADRPSTDQKATSKAPPPFKIKCKGFDDSSACGADEKNDVRSYLKEAYRDYVSGFREPDLPSPIFGNRLKWKIKKKGTTWCKNVAGKYLGLSNVAITCYNGKGDPSRETTRHEFFHAIQWNYARISWDQLPQQRPDWLVEATATFAGDPKSNATTAHRYDGRRLRRVTRPLRQKDNPHNPAYRLQDFWVYMINRRGTTPANFLEPLFKSDADVPVLAVLDGKYSFSDDHWGWVRNQVFESKVTQGNLRLSGQCQYDARTVASQADSIYYSNATDGPIDVSVSIGQLRAGVVKFVLENKLDPDQVAEEDTMFATVKADTSGTDTYARVYKNYSSPTDACLFSGGRVPQCEECSAASVDVPVPPGETRVAYMMLSNSSAPPSTEGPVELGVGHIVL